MPNIAYLILAIVMALAAAALGLYAFARWASRREPYATFMRLSTRQKLRFFRRLMTDRRVPWYVRVIPALTALYLLNPIDLIPDFLPVVGYLDDVAVVLASLALVMRLTPRAVVEELLRNSSME